MASLLGSMVAGGVAGGAAAQQKFLFDDIEEKRKLSFAKIQQDYAQQNAELVNKLTMGREDKEREWNDANSVIERGQQLSDLEKKKEYDAQLLEGERDWQTQKTAADQAFELKKYNAERANARADFTWQQSAKTAAEKKQIEDAVKLRESNFKMIEQTDAFQNLPLTSQEALKIKSVYGIELPAKATPTKLTDESMKQGATIVQIQIDESGKKPKSPEEHAAAVNKAARIVQDATDAKASGELEAKDLISLAALTRLETSGDTDSAASLAKTYAKIKDLYGKAEMNKMKTQVDNMAASGVSLMTISPQKNKKFNTNKGAIQNTFESLNLGAGF